MPPSYYHLNANTFVADERNMRKDCDRVDASDDGILMTSLSRHAVAAIHTLKCSSLACYLSFDSGLLPTACSTESGRLFSMC
jgi:hypothetical protein